MQNHTTIGGYNLIVSSLLVPGQALAAPFPFSFIQNELREYYDDWKIISIPNIQNQQNIFHTHM